MRHKNLYYIPLEEINRNYLTTREAAFYLNRSPRTLRAWATNNSGPLSARKIISHWAWSVKEIKNLLGDNNE